MEAFIQQLINGLSVGSVYALIALGYTMVYGIIKLINFAHGDIYMIGAFVSYFMFLNLELNIFVTLALTMLVTAILGVIIEKVAYKPLRNSPRITALITAIAVSYLLQNIMIYVVGPEAKSFPQIIQNKQYTIGSVSIGQMEILLLGTSLVLMVLLQFIVQKTKMGKAMRAVSIDSKAAELMGINPNTIISFTFLLGSALAGAGGLLVGMYYNTINPMMGTAPGLKAFVAAVFGGIGVIPGAMVGGLLIGTVEVMISAYGNSMIRDAVVYFILILILLIRPSGLFGKSNKEKV
ncbi:branched-chain amino acid ABC transporter permease [Tetragenococcus halophilus subsp. flandriensis]|uniref:branched-chain amino acid ABC transporter permease n=1 Tax=Tetragenococcus halophilus TaxID=51669 RepID=UPI0023E96B67|nr:branched-chain amino acid ABC transporter permease [Tetragenococcus halophilus]GMA08664.1 branched-chain amino acid ABC transporter permease [Tetragenococcus halophilus subsp. flandriensis]